MMLECRPGESLAMAAFMHHSDQGHNTINHCVAHKGLKSPGRHWSRCLAGDVLEAGGSVSYRDSPSLVGLTAQVSDTMGLPAFICLPNILGVLRQVFF